MSFVALLVAALLSLPALAAQPDDGGSAPVAGLVPPGASLDGGSAPVAGSVPPGASLDGRTPSDPYPTAAASYIVAIDDRIVWARDPDTPRRPASLTKIMTALVLLEGGWSPDAHVVVSRRAAAETGSRLGLRPGERMRAGDALLAMLLHSANDAAVALAEHAAGSEASFVARMNGRARALGMTHTRFANASGQDAPEQRLSARDLLVLSRAALARPDFAHLVATPSATVSTIAGRAFPLENNNVLLGKLPGVAGVKSGYTGRAGKCFVGSAERDGTRVSIVLLDSPNRWWTAAALFEEAFDAARGRN